MHHLDTQEVHDAGEACYLIGLDWKLEEVRTLQRWSHGHFSETTSYVLGLPDNAGRDVAEVSLTI